jgi:uncharacterized protein YndB with AHSA1/START domain
MWAGYVATSTISIQASASRVWAVLTDREAIKEFMFGTDITTEWEVGGPIFWRGVWKGSAYEDRGTILEYDPGRRLVVTHFSPLSGQEDKPENYHTLAWTLESASGTTQLTLTQDNNANTEQAQHAKGMWDALVSIVKTIAERK